MSTAPIVVVGASLAGLRAVEAFRKAGYDGPLTLIGAEPHLPYDRPPLSKRFLDSGDADGPQVPTYRSRSEFSDLNADLRLGTPASALDPDSSEVVLADGQRQPYSRLVITTGAHARALPGGAMAGVHTLRTLDDAQVLRRDLEHAQHVLVVGAGFIGSEVAAAARRRGCEVTIVEAAEVPLIRAVGAQMAPVCAALHARHGVELRGGVSVSELHGNGRVEQVALSDGTMVAADVVVVGIGAEPNTGWLTGSGVAVDDGVVCDEMLATGVPGVFAAGDVASWPNPLFDQRMRLEHWTSASEQAAAAARNALDPSRAQPHQSVPYFWSDWYTEKLQMVGVCASDDVEMFGDADGERWVALYRRGDRIHGALSLNLPGKIMKFRALINRRAPWTDAVELATQIFPRSTPGSPATS